MHSLFVLGRIAFVVIFIVSGATKLMDINAAAGMIANKVTIPAQLNDLKTQIEAATGMTTPQLLAIAAGVVELACGLLIALNFGTRFFALVLLIFVAVATFYYHDFWNMSGAERSANFIQALKNLSIMGGLLILFAIGPWRPMVVERLD